MNKSFRELVESTLLEQQLEEGIISSIKHIGLKAKAILARPIFHNLRNESNTNVLDKAVKHMKLADEADVFHLGGIDAGNKSRRKMSSDIVNNPNAQSSHLSVIKTSTLTHSDSDAYIRHKNASPVSVNKELIDRLGHADSTGKLDSNISHVIGRNDLPTYALNELTDKLHGISHHSIYAPDPNHPNAPKITTEQLHAHLTNILKHPNVDKETVALVAQHYNASKGTKSPHLEHELLKHLHQAIGQVIKQIDRGDPDNNHVANAIHSNTIQHPNSNISHYNKLLEHPKLKEYTEVLLKRHNKN